ncbi:hypothetical protein P8452_48202 [Trifolium repens]|nr:hypothetical protein P8452_48202 [Trifolium repens]
MELVSSIQSWDADLCNNPLTCIESISELVNGRIDSVDFWSMTQAGFKGIIISRQRLGKESSFMFHICEGQSTRNKFERLLVTVSMLKQKMLQHVMSRGSDPIEAMDKLLTEIWFRCYV